jgi:hypothetical protein
MSDVAAIRERLLERAYLYDDPSSYAAGVRAALRALMGRHEGLEEQHDEPASSAAGM